MRRLWDRLDRLKHHPLPMRARFTHSLVLTYAFDPEVLRPLLTPGLELDTYRAPDGREYAFAAAAVLGMRGLRPALLPEQLGCAQIMTGYRVFARFRAPRGNPALAGKTMRGLRILRSDISSPLIAFGGNLLTRYHYRLAHLGCRVTDDRLDFAVRSRDGLADLRVSAALSPGPAPLPAGSPFADARAARRFAGPCPTPSSTTSAAAPSSS
jgi:hypothetical protein